MIVRGNADYTALKTIYDTLNDIIDNDNCFFSKEETKEMKEDDKNIFIGG
nr:MAG TPA: hypothetical protein [Caudoviricetes sp.]